MPITLVTGTPGAGKTALVVSMIVEAAKAGRTCYVHNIPNLTVEHVPLPDPKAWHEEGGVEDGSLVVIDEVQAVWRPAHPSSGIHPSIKALETHRHRGLDFIVSTQNPALLHVNVRSLVGRHIHLRHLGALGRRWYEWPEIAQVDRWRTAPVKKSYRVPKEVFGRYTSATVHVQAKKGLPTAVWLLLASLLFMAGVGLYAWRGSTRKPDAGTYADVSSSAGADGAGAGSTGGVGGVGALGVPSWAPSSPEPYSGLQIHLVGWFGEYLLFAVSAPHAASRVLTYLSAPQLLRAGYSIRVDAPCSVTLSHSAGVRRVTCDGPLSGADQPAPSPAGSISAGPSLFP
jgi:zona occludens toxin (predicted ATPase)